MQNIPQLRSPNSNSTCVSYGAPKIVWLVWSFLWILGQQQVLERHIKSIQPLIVLTFLKVYIYILPFLVSYTSSTSPSILPNTSRYLISKLPVMQSHYMKSPEACSLHLHCPTQRETCFHFLNTPGKKLFYRVMLYSYNLTQFLRIQLQV